ncbi:hypothetical protein [Myroides indicus]|uniref:Lipoprotein n=1 Tax=Myroides indicus TaxID=1323422 RepID=A0A4R7F3Y6_9FLAO|nr:hypothetical protein [Myroides indicus]TDS58209.1 hypothetical protein C8P70_11240 [Myroides indicus]
MIKSISYRLAFFTVIAVLFSGCQTFFKVVTGVSSTMEYQMKNPERLKYYQPYLEADNISIYTLKNPEEFCKNINYFGSQLGNVYFEDTENNEYYVVNCFDDIRDTFEDLNNGDISFLKCVSEEDFLPIKNYITQTSEMVVNQENQKQRKKWNVYLSWGTFMGKKLKKRTATVTKINELNYLYILDLSVDSTNKAITEKDFQTTECAEFTKEKVDYLR